MGRSAEFECWLRRAVEERVGFGVAIHYTRNQDLADELTQEAYGRALEHWEAIESEAHLRNWLRLVIARLAQDHGRRRTRSRVRFLAEPDAVPDHRLPQGNREHGDFVRHYLERLSREDQQLIALRYFQGLTLEEIRAVYPEWGSVSTLSKRVKAVCAQLLELMSQDEERGAEPAWRG